MAPEYYDLKRNEPLPPIDGPKLGPFQHHELPIRFLELLSPAPGSRESPTQQSSSADSGGHGHVFRVRIGKSEYALKVFKFFDGFLAAHTSYWRYKDEVDGGTMVYHSDPFFAECRAYGKINQIQERRQKRTKKGKPADIAVPCYGYMSLPAIPYEKMFRTEFGIVNWSRTPKDLKRRPEKRARFRALVKKIINNREPIESPVKMAKDLKILQRGGVIPRDICERNYVGGLLVDFGAAWTKPHWALDLLSKERIDDTKEEDLLMFDIMLHEAGAPLKYRLSRTKETYRKLRRLPNHPFRTNMQHVLVFDS